MFLQFVARQLLGKPVSSSCGRLTYHCPFHQPDRSPSFCILPPKAGCKDRYRCFACGVFGDEYDLVRLFYPHDNYSQRCERVRQLQIEYNKTSGISLRGKQRGGEVMPTPVVQPTERVLEDGFAFPVMQAEMEIAKYLEADDKLDAFQFWTTALEICGRHQVTIQDVADYCQRTRQAGKHLTWQRTPMGQAWLRSKVKQGLEAIVPESESCV